MAGTPLALKIRRPNRAALTALAAIFLFYPQQALDGVGVSSDYIEGHCVLEAEIWSIYLPLVVFLCLDTHSTRLSALAGYIILLLSFRPPFSRATFPFAQLWIRRRPRCRPGVRSERYNTLHAGIHHGELHAACPAAWSHPPSIVSRDCFMRRGIILYTARTF